MDMSSKVGFVIIATMTAACAAPPPPKPPTHPARAERVERSPDREARVEVKMPTLPEGASCRAARSAYIETWQLEAGSGKADLSEGQFGMVLGRGHYIQRCDVPDDYQVNICAAVRNGQVLGATVSTSPRAPRLERCIDRSVRNMGFPVHPRLDITRTVFR